MHIQRTMIQITKNKLILNTKIIREGKSDAPLIMTVSHPVQKAINQYRYDNELQKPETKKENRIFN